MQTYQQEIKEHISRETKHCLEYISSVFDPRHHSYKSELEYVIDKFQKEMRELCYKEQAKIGREKRTLTVMGTRISVNQAKY